MKIIIGEHSIIGSSHKKKSIENQDSVISFEQEKYIFLSVSDGHGSKQYFRSKIGSQTAVDIAHRKMSSFAKSYFLKEKPERLLQKKYSGIESIIFDNLLNDLKNDIIATWKQEVSNDLAKNPYQLIHESINLMPNEDKKNDERFIIKYDAKEIIIKQQDYNELLNNPISPYGCTLLATLISDMGVIVLKLGDGDIRFIEDDQIVNPIPPELEPDIGDATDSMCSTTVADKTKIWMHKEHPSAVFLSSDGVIKSLVNGDEDYNNLMDSIYNSLQKESKEVVSEKLKEVLSKMANIGGDDTTLAYYVKVKDLIEEQDILKEKSEDDENFSLKSF
jgi:serine/threonine protein phosphatase PrpC